MSDSEETGNSDVIWHYTDGAGLLGILNADYPHIYATDALYLNDTRELMIALDHQVEIIKRDFLPDDLVGEHDVRRIYKLAIGDSLNHVAPPEGVYISSFCKKGDLLSQWRGYGTAAGYALGVSRTEFGAALASEDKLIDVQYGRPDEQFVKHLQPKSLNIGTQTTFAADPAAVAALKDPSFAEEDEVRLVALAGSRDVHFRSGARGLIPFLKVDLPLTCVKAIRLGPGLSGEPAVRAMERLVSQLGIPDVKVLSSETPYRN